MKLLIPVISIITLCTISESLSLNRRRRQLEREELTSPSVSRDSILENADKDDDKEDNKKSVDEASVNPDDDTELVEIDLNKNDGSVNFGGHIPGRGRVDIRKVMRRLFETLNKRFHDMDNGFGNHFPNFGGRRQFPTFGRFPSFGNLPKPFGNVPKAADFPKNYNDTKTDIVTIAGKQYVKKETVVKKDLGNTKVFLTQVSYVPVNEAENKEDEVPEKPTDQPDVLPVDEEPVEGRSGRLTSSH